MKMDSYFSARRLLSSFCALVIIFLLSGCDSLKPDSNGGSVPEGAVDLGLSVKWASCNLGASSPEEFGDYYAWGETKPKGTYDWSSYKFALPGIKYDVA